MDSFPYEQQEMTNLPTLVNGYILASADRPAVLSEKREPGCVKGWLTSQNFSPASTHQHYASVQ